MIVTAGATNRFVYFYIQEDAGATNPGEPVPALLFSSLDAASYARAGGARVAITLKTLASASAAHDDGGFILVDDTNMAGTYRLDVPDAAFTTGVDQVIVQIDPGAARVCAPVLVDITDMDLRDAVRGGMTALPNAAANAPGGLAISDAGGLDLDTKLANTNEVTAARMGALTDWIDGGRLDVLLDAIPTTAMRGTDGALTDKAGFSLSTAGILAVWHQALSAVVTAGSVGKLLKDEITAARMAVLTDWINGGRLDLLLDAIPTTAMRGTDGVDTTAAAALVDLVWDEILTGATHNVADSAGRRIRDLQEFGVYDNGAIWIDTVNGSAGTTDFENGTAFNPVNTIADANTLAASLGISKFEILAGSTITLAATQQNQVFNGENWTLALGGQDIAGSHFTGATVSGIATGTGTDQHFEKCDIGGVTLLDHTTLLGCAFSGTITLPVGDLFTHQCFMATAAGAIPIIDFGAAVLNTNVHLHDWRGRIEFQNLGQSGTDAIHLDGQGKITFNANCVGGTINWRGAFELVNNGSGITINDDARYDQAQILQAMTSDDVKFQGADIAAILADVTGIAGAAIRGTDNAALASVATEARLAELDTANLPADVDTIKAAATEARLAELGAANLPADIDTLLTRVSDVVANLVWNVLRNSHTTAGSMAESFQGVVNGKAQTGTLSTTMMTTDLAETTDDHYIGRTIVWITGALTGQASDVTDYAGTNGTLTFTAVTEAPANNDRFVLV